MTGYNYQLGELGPSMRNRCSAVTHIMRTWMGGAENAASGSWKRDYIKVYIHRYNPEM